MKIVIFTQRVEIIESYQERRDCADQRIADFISACGFLPVPVPNKSNLAEKIIEKIQPAGILLTGGNSLQKYGGNAPERDAMDSELIRLAVCRKIPVYGFCRGMQSILVYFGNKLSEIKGHVAVRHMVKGKNGCYEVNSYHNQACIEIARNCGLAVTAQAADGVVEAVCHKEFPIVGTMWHPEREKKFRAEDVKIVKALFGYAEGGRLKK